MALDSVNPRKMLKNSVSRETKLREASPKVIKLFPCSTQLSMKFFLLINVKMPTIVGILIYKWEK